MLDRTFLKDTKDASRGKAQDALFSITQLVLKPSIGVGSCSTLERVVVHGGKKIKLTHLVFKEWVDAVVPCLPGEADKLFQLLCRQVYPQAGLFAELTPAGLAALCKLLQGLAPRFSVQAIVPRRAIPLIRWFLECANSLVDQEHVATPAVYEKGELSEACPEIAVLIQSELLDKYALGRSSVYSAVHDFLVTLCLEVERFAAFEIEPPPFEPIRGTYNPAVRGVALYFTDHGQQGRHVRRYQRRSKKQPEQDEDACLKHFHGKRRLTGGLFSFFCPCGFSYGTAIIKHHEGRVHPFNCLYTHAERPPDIIIYDFSCQLMEYCLSREPGFFGDVRFFIDKFHYWNHAFGACSLAFRITRIARYGRYNDSIAEQWHASIDHLKAHMTCLTQLRYMFTVQVQL